MDYDNVGTPTLPSSSHGSIFTALLVSMVGILATSLAVVLYHIVIVKYCLSRQPAVVSAAADLLAQPVSTGVDAKVLETIPILPYSKQRNEGSPFHANQSECAVCLAELEEDDIVRLLPSCRHAFHITCIDQWFTAHTNCPICRSPVTNGGSRPRRHLNDQLLPRGQSSSCLLQPTEIGGESRRPPPVTAGGLKRSLSMGQSYVIIDVRRESEKLSSSSSTSKTILGRSRSYRGRSMRQLDGASTTLRRSFSRLRNGLSGRFNRILPY